MLDLDSQRDAIATRLHHYQSLGKRLFATSSFQTNSVVLLHLAAQLAPAMPVFFINTGYHFPETLAFKRDLERRLNIRVTDLFSSMPRSQQRDAAGRLLFASDPDYCCHLNKVEPLEPILARHDVWVNGIRAAQSATRREMQEEQPWRDGVVRYHPLLHWTDDMVNAYIERYQLPRHPLDRVGYSSIGCHPCTRPPVDADGRNGRWYGLNKTECGLHLTPGKR